MSLYYYDDVSADLASGGTTLSPERLEAMYKRDSTADFQVKQLRKIKESYASPSTYFENKAKAMEDASSESAEIFSREYLKLVKNLVPSATAQIRARKLANAHQEAMEASIEEDWPSDMSKLNLKLVAGQGQMNKNGFADPDASLVRAVARKPRKARK